MISARAVALLLAAASALILISPRHRPPNIPADAATRISPAALRVRYPERNAPALILPDGRRRSVASVLSVSKPMRFGDYLWDDRDIPRGPVWLRIDLRYQTLSIFRAGHEIGTALILYGTDGKPTPTGMFKVLEKSREHRSTLYDAAMPFMLRLTGDGVAIHASDVRAGSATHGCIGIPAEFARRLFDQVTLGDEVAILPAVRSDRPSND